MNMIMLPPPRKRPRRNLGLGRPNNFEIRNVGLVVEISRRCTVWIIEGDSGLLREILGILHALCALGSLPSVCRSLGKSPILPLRRAESPGSSFS